MGVKPLPPSTGFVIIGGGFAGAATAWALGRQRAGRGVVLEQEYSFGVHASGRNAAIFKLADHDPVVGALARRSYEEVLALESSAGELLRTQGGLTIASRDGSAQLHAQYDALMAAETPADWLDAAEACRRFPCLDAMRFDTAMFCPGEGVVDIHALLTRYVSLARDSGVPLHTGCRVEALLVEHGHVTGVHTSLGDVRADVVVDASGAWAGRLGQGDTPLPLQPMRRHLFVSAPIALVAADAPFVWVDDAGLYFRPEGDGLLFSPCDETASEPCLPSTDPAAAELLADKVARHAPGLGDLAIRRQWACLRTFAPDRRPLIGPDPNLAGLFHVSGLGGFGMTCSAAVGLAAAALLTGETPGWVDASATAPGRLGRPLERQKLEGPKAE